MGFLRSIQPSYLGLMTVHMWIYCTVHRPINTGGVSIMMLMYVFLSLYLFCLALIVFKQKLGDRARRAMDTLTLPFMMCSTIFLTFPLPFTGALTTVFGSALGGIGVAWLYMRWGEFYSKLEIRRAAPLIFLTMALGSFGKTIIDLLPTLGATAVLICMPFLSLYLVSRAQKNTSSSKPAYLYYNARTIRSLWRLALGIAIYSFVVGLLQSMPLEMPPAPYVPMVLAHHGGEIIIALAFFCWVVFFKRGLNFSRTWRIVLLLMATALIFASQLGEIIGGYFYVAIAIAQTALIILLFLALADIAHHSIYPPMIIFAVGWIAYSLPFPLGDIVGSSLQLIESSASLIMSIIVWILVIVSLFFLDERAVDKQPIFPELKDEDDDDASAKRIGAIQDSLDNPNTADTLTLRCSILADEYKLTPREHEVLELLVRGRSKVYIAEAFFVSENTVRGHVKRLYAKMDVHSKQELIDRVELVDI